ncbi:hypothetical protein [Natrinema salsiterrestre]|uniref:hypothetical protein n=1 Tax=Natrinema salsiterrestre TaxID=2950540 RepID=UPI0027D97467|nr:hypothetical protein [Natrinema salsiterrestre]
MNQRPDADPIALEAADCTPFKQVCYQYQGATVRRDHRRATLRVGYRGPWPR